MAEGRRPSSVVMFRCRTEPCEEIHGSGGLRVSRHESTTTAKGCCWPANGGGVCNSCGEAVGCLGHLRCVVLLLLVGGTCGWKEGVCPPRHVQIDLGVYYCDTLQLFKYLPASVVPSGHQWEVWGFEATPYIATFAQKCAAALSRGMPLPPKPATSRTRGTSPSEEDLASRFRAAHDEMRTAQRCPQGASGNEFHIVHAAASDRNGTVLMDGSADEGAWPQTNGTFFRSKKWNEPGMTSQWQTPTVDLSGWLLSTFSPKDFILLKMDIEGGEAALLPTLIASGAMRLVDQFMWECHASKPWCRSMEAQVGRITGRPVLTEPWPGMIQDSNGLYGVGSSSSSGRPITWPPAPPQPWYTVDDCHRLTTAAPAASHKPRAAAPAPKKQPAATHTVSKRSSTRALLDVAPNTAHSSPFVLVSMATVPSRFNLLRDGVERIQRQTRPPDDTVLIVPHRFARLPNASVAAPKWMMAPPSRVHVFRGVEDHGPMTKILGAVRYAHCCVPPQQQRTALLITLDDDIVYPSWLLENLIEWALRKPGAIVAYAGGDYRRVNDGENDDITYQTSMWGAAPGVVAKRPIAPCSMRRVTYIHGWAGVAYPLAPLDNVPLFDHVDWLTGSGGCWWCDDHYVSGLSTQARLPMYVVPHPVEDAPAPALWKAAPAPSAARPPAKTAQAERDAKRARNMVLKQFLSGHFEEATWRAVPDPTETFTGCGSTPSLTTAPGRRLNDEHVRTHSDNWKTSLTFIGKTPLTTTFAGQTNVSKLVWSSHCGQDHAAFELLGRMRGGFFVDCAANDPVFDSNSYALELRHGWKGICVEANLNEYHWGLSHRRCTNAFAVVGDGSQVTFRFKGGVGGIISSQEPGKKGVYLTRPTTPLADILDRGGAPSVIDYLSLDVRHR